MAFVISDSVSLSISPHPTDVKLLNVEVAFVIRFTEFDRVSRLDYLECVEIIGVDQFPGEDNTDDTVASISATNVVCPPDTTGLFRSAKASVARSVLDEDQPPVPNPDELQARVTLTPQLPQQTSSKSKVQVINLP